jgi:hypothetical protein
MNYRAITDISVRTLGLENTVSISREQERRDCVWRVFFLSFARSCCTLLYGYVRAPLLVELYPKETVKSNKPICLGNKHNSLFILGRRATARATSKARFDLALPASP